MPQDVNDLLHGALDVLVLRTLSWAPVHRLHSAIGYITPADRLAGRSEQIWATRDARLEPARVARQLAHQAVAA